MSMQIEYTQENLVKLKRIEREAYAGTGYMQMQHCESWSDVAAYCECSLEDLHIAFINDGYIVAACHDGFVEVVDPASSGRNMNLFAACEFIRELGKPMFLDAREKTSYRFVKGLERRGEIHIIEDTSHDWEGEVFHEIKCEFAHPHRYYEHGRN